MRKMIKKEKKKNKYMINSFQKLVAAFLFILFFGISSFAAFTEDLMKIGFVIDKNSWYWTNNEKDTINACVVNLCEDDSHESVGAKIIKNMYSVVCVKRK